MAELGLWAFARFGQTGRHASLEVGDDFGGRMTIQGRVC